MKETKRIPLNNQDMKVIVDELLLRSGLDITVKLEDVFQGGRLVGGKYQMDSKTITMYTKMIEEQCLQLFGSLDCVLDYFKVVVAHEIGHAADQELTALSDALDCSQDLQECSRISLQIEENAWRYALLLIPDIDPPFINEIIDQSLQSYRDELKPAIA